jgi:hypothetical protein
MTTSVYSTNNNLRNINYDIIIKSLIYKQLNPPYYRIYKCIGKIISKAFLLIFDVQGKGRIYQTFVYDINNNIVKYRHFYYSEKERKEEMKQNRKKKLRKAKYTEYK